MPGAFHQLLPNAMDFTPNDRENAYTLYAMHFSAITTVYNGMTAYVCRRFSPATAFL